jgi:hypothetical protein
MESENMARIYQNAVLTICASHGENDSIGCYVKRDGILLTPCILEIPSELRLGGTGHDERTVYAICSEAAITSRIPPPRALKGRAWAMQENLLSHRKVIFDGDEIRWQCRQNSASQGAVVPELNYYDLDTSNDTNPSNILEYLNDILATNSSTTSKRPSDVELEKLKLYWHYLVTQYCRRHLSHQTDRLAAIAGNCRVHRPTYFSYIHSRDMEGIVVA